MGKSLMINIMIDDVELDELETLLGNIAKAIEEYENKRMSVTIQDESMLGGMPR